MFKVYQFITLCVVFGATSGTGVNADEGEPGWVLELEPMYLWLAEGDDSYGPAIENRSVFDGAAFGPFSTTRDLKSDFDDEGLTFRGELQRRRDDEWGYGIMGWWFDTDTTAVNAMPEGTARGTFFSTAGDYRGGVLVPSLSGFDTDTTPFAPTDGITPFTNGQFIDNVFNTLSFMADAEFDLWKIDIHGMRELGESRPERTWDFLFGIELVEVNAARNEIVRNILAGPTDASNDDIITTIEHAAAVDYGVAFGPMLGLQYERREDKHRIKALVTQSFVFADADERASVTGTVDNRLTSTITAAQLGSAKSDDSETLAITEVKLAYNYDFAEKTSLGLGGFLSVWWDAPMAPSFNNTAQETLVFLGVFASAQFRFD